MAKRIKVGSRYRRGFKLNVGGEWKWFAPGELLPEEFNDKIPGRFFRDKRAIWVEDVPVKKVRPAPVSIAPTPVEESQPVEAEAPVAKEPATEPAPKRRRTKKVSSKSGGLSE